MKKLFFLFAAFLTIATFSVNAQSRNYRVVEPIQLHIPEEIQGEVSSKTTTFVKSFCRDTTTYTFFVVANSLESIVSVSVYTNEEPTGDVMGKGIAKCLNETKVGGNDYAALIACILDAF